MTASRVHVMPEVDVDSQCLISMRFSATDYTNLDTVHKVHWMRSIYGRHVMTLELLGRKPLSGTQV